MTNAVNVNSKILIISASAAAMMIICPYLVLFSPRFFNTGKMIPTEDVTMINEKYQRFFTSTILEAIMAVIYDSANVKKNIDRPGQQEFIVQG